MILSYYAYHILYLPYHINSVCNTYTDVYIHWEISKYKKNMELTCLYLIAGIYLNLYK